MLQNDFNLNVEPAETQEYDNHTVSMVGFFDRSIEQCVQPRTLEGKEADKCKAPSRGKADARKMKCELYILN